MKKTLTEIQQEAADAAVAHVNQYYEALDGLKKRTKPMLGGHEDRLSPQESHKLLIEQNIEEARAAREKALEGYKGELQEGYEKQVAGGKEAAAELYRTEDKVALDQALGADAEKLKGMLEYAKISGDKDFGRAVLFAADQGGHATVIAEYFNSLDPSGAARETYKELKKVPLEADLERQLANADRLVPVPTGADVTSVAQPTDR